MNDKIEELYNNLDVKDKIINEQALEIARLREKIDNVKNYIKWHYDLGTKDNVEFCLLRDRLLEILGEKENE